MKTLHLDDILCQNFLPLEKIEAATIFCELGIFNYLLMKQKTWNDVFQNKIWVIYNQQYFKELKVETIPPFIHAKVISLEKHCEHFRLYFENNENPLIYVYELEAVALEEHNTDLMYIIEA